MHSRFLKHVQENREIMRHPLINIGRKGLSPLLATAILISATIAGGAILYQYFAKSLSMYTAGSSIEVTVSAVYLSSDRYLLYYSITSRGDQPVNLSHIYFLPNGSLPQISLGNKTLLPGGRITGVQELTGQMPSSLYAVVVYYYGGSRIETKPVEVTS
ncbi:MAG: hypothetical protein QXW41_04165 [Fervidicoccaceae archaeon]|jgi:archaellum component FlaF (FlaF/FlaG flagellin family)